MVGYIWEAFEILSYVSIYLLLIPKFNVNLFSSFCVIKQQTYIHTLILKTPLIPSPCDIRSVIYPLIIYPAFCHLAIVLPV